jgi:hypothetical protein
MSNEANSLGSALPLRLLTPIRMTSKAPIVSPGVFLPPRTTDPLLLAFNWDGEPTLMTLEGQFAFHHFKQQLGHSVTGILVKDVEFLADLTSRYDSSKEDDPMGALITSEGKLFVIGMRSGDRFGDPHPVPLWGDYGEASAEVKVGFTRWKIVARDGDERVTIWSTPEEEDKAD